MKTKTPKQVATLLNSELIIRDTYYLIDLKKFFGMDKGTANFEREKNGKKWQLFGYTKNDRSERINQLAEIVGEDLIDEKFEYKSITTAVLQALR